MPAVITAMVQQVEMKDKSEKLNRIMSSRPRNPRDEVFEQIRSFLGKQASTSCQQRLFEIALAALRRTWAEGPPLLFIEVPMAVHIAAGGDRRRATSIAAACALVFLGADILDDLADGESRPEWERSTTGEVTLAAATCLSALAPLALSEIKLPARTVAKLHRTLTHGLLRMAAGQYDDLHSTAQQSETSPEAVEDAVAGKSGEEFAMFCALAAVAAGANARVTRHYAAMGKAIGTGGQIASDCYELFEDPEARDLRQGTLTLPLALHISRLSGAEKAEFRKRLVRARTSATSRERIRKLVRSSGALRMAVFTVETYRQRALRELDCAKPIQEGRDRLHNLIDSISFFGGEIRDGAQADAQLSDPLLHPVRR